MNAQVKQVLQNKGYSELFNSIDNSIRDLKRAGYTKGEVFETIVNTFDDNGGKLTQYINKQKERFYQL